MKDVCCLFFWLSAKTDTFAMNCGRTLVPFLLNKIEHWFLCYGIRIIGWYLCCGISMSTENIGISDMDQEWRLVPLLWIECVFWYPWNELYVKTGAFAMNCELRLALLHRIAFEMNNDLWLIQMYFSNWFERRLVFTVIAEEDLCIKGVYCGKRLAYLFLAIRLMILYVFFITFHSLIW